MSKKRSVHMAVAVGFLVFCSPLWIAQVKSEEPGQGFEFGFQHRIRFVDYDNIQDYSDAMKDHNQFFRFRTRLWGRLLRESLEFKLALANEFRHYYEPDKDDHYDEIFVDECYLKLDDMFDSGWSVKAGRQNIIKGDGFLIFDGSPLDGSRSIYFNALLLDWKFGHSNLEFLAISDPAKDQYFDRIGDQSKPLIERDETALGICYTYRPAPERTLEAIWLYKTESSPYEPASPKHQPKRAYHVIDGRAAFPAGRSGTFTCEIAGEFGEQDPDRSIRAWSGYATWKHRFACDVSPQFILSAAAFSGDKKETDDDEGWTPPFSRWPEWSELYIYSLARERGVAWWSDLWFASAEFAVTPVKPVKIQCSYYRLMSLESNDTSSGIFGEGKTRGDLFEIRTEFTLVKGLTGHVLYEYNLPGSFYAEDDAGHFFRVELTYQFSHWIPSGGSSSRTDVN